MKPLSLSTTTVLDNFYHNIGLWRHNEKAKAIALAFLLLLDNQKTDLWYLFS